MDSMAFNLWLVGLGCCWIGFGNALITVIADSRGWDPWWNWPRIPARVALAIGFVGLALIAAAALVWLVGWAS